MSDQEPETPHWKIFPEPTELELIALLTALRSGDVEPRIEDELAESCWTRTTRLEQLRTSLNERGEGWGR